MKTNQLDRRLKKSLLFQGIRFTQYFISRYQKVVLLRSGTFLDSDRVALECRVAGLIEGSVIYGDVIPLFSGIRVITL